MRETVGTLGEGVGVGASCQGMGEQPSFNSPHDGTSAQCVHWWALQRGGRAVIEYRSPSKFEV